MTKAVFIASTHSHYDDRPGEAYHFPNSYLSRVAQTVGDWVLFFEGRRGGARGYYAVQRVARIEPDPGDRTHSYAVLDRETLLELPRKVPRLKGEGKTWETGLPLSRGSNTSAVRLISEGDFAAILSEGMRSDDAPDAMDRTPGLEDVSVPFDWGVLRPQVLVNRAFRDRAFARLVKQAYGGRCAVSGLELRNGGGRPEVEAAHIIPVEARGPDILRNGLALSGTLHWMFDRGLISVDDDHSVLIARQSLADDVARRLIRPEGRILLPDHLGERPHPQFLRWHREKVFKG